MSKVRRTWKDNTQLPKEMADWMTRPFKRFLHIEAAGGAVLLLFTLAAVVLANSPWAEQFLRLWEIRIGFQLGTFEFVRSLRGWVNDGSMTLFFFLVAMELKRELVLGELRNPRMAALSLLAAIGGMLTPAVFYLLLQSGLPGENGWGTVMASDTAFIIGCLALVGTRVPKSLRIFMLSLAIIDDVGAILVVAVGYSHHITWLALVLGAIGFLAVRAMAMIGIRSIPIYVILGTLIWLAMDASGIHATVTGVLLGLMTPARRWVSDERLYAILGQVIAHPDSHAASSDTKDRQTLHMAETATREALSPVERLVMVLHPWVGFVIMPLFAIANAGVPLSIDKLANSVTAAVVVGFALGKPIGVMLFSVLAVRTGIAVRPADLTWRLLAGGSLLAGIGFTMALFIANVAFSSDLLDSAKLGIFLASMVSAVAGITVLMWPLQRRRLGVQSSSNSQHADIASRVVLPKEG